ncbi:MAG: FKBP-type peptidyl-prolyl cis-trans isomerase [Thiotrichales bacterium]|nr:FKBP-type peptidyl-prolyl cis-trans isomerase [Thiotrichales bacterium]
MSQRISSLPVVQSDSEISLAFRMSLMDGTLVEEATAQAPFRFQLGQGAFLDKIEELLIGLELGTTAKLTLAPESAFGYSNPENIQRMPLSDFPDDLQPKVGQVIGFQTPTGQEVPGTILAVDAEEVTVDFNHPLADTMVVFEATILTVHGAA